jgi:hypothetical protein
MTSRHSNDTVRPSVKSDETEEAHETGSRDEHAEARDSGREGEEKIRSIDISSANLYIYGDQVDKGEREVCFTFFSLFRI